MRSMFVFVVLASLSAAACSSDPSGNDAPAATSDATADTFELDAPALDTAVPVEDTSALDSTAADVADAPPPFDIIGSASGECGGIVAAAVKATTSVQIEIPISFDTMDKWERARLSPGGQKIFDAPNAGGSSKESEVMTYEMLFHCDGAALLKTETEIQYGPAPDGGSATISDMIVTLAGEKVGVNPKRVFKPLPLTMSDAEVKDQLTKNFQSLNSSSARVLPEDKWVKQILHLWVPSATYYDQVKRVLPTIDAAVKSNTIVLITRSTGGGFLYCDPDPALGSECPPI